MPPAAARRPEAAAVETALGSLKRALTDANLAARGELRTPLRRLTRLEYAYTIADLLQVDEAVGLDLSQGLPAEADSGGFDTVAANQSMSPLHVRAYLEAADRALDAALSEGASTGSGRAHDRVRRLAVTCRSSRMRRPWGSASSRRWTTPSWRSSTSARRTPSTAAPRGFVTAAPGRYRVTVDAYPYQARTPVTVTVYRGKMAGVAASLDELIGVFDLDGPRAVELTPYLRPGDLIGLSVADLDAPSGVFPQPVGGDPSKGYGGMKDYPGEGIAFRSLTIEGPLLDADVLAAAEHPATAGGDRVRRRGRDCPDEDTLRARPRRRGRFRAPRVSAGRWSPGELESYASLAAPLLVDGRPFVEAVRVPLRAILSAPAFLFQAGDAGRLDDFALASRLSYFLWRSMPDDELFDAARAGPAVGAGGAGRAGRPDARRRPVEAVRAGLRRAGVAALRVAGDQPGRRALSGVRRPARAGDGAGDRAVPGRVDRGGPRRGSPDRRRLHLREPSPRAALRPAGRRRPADAQGCPAGGQPPRRAADAGERCSR